MIKILLFASTLVALAMGAEMPRKKKPEIVDSNHFYSE